MDFVVVGLGSMGRRRIRLLKRISSDFTIFGVDGRNDRREQAEKELKINTCEKIESVFRQNKPECAIVSTSPLSHADVIEECLKNDCHVFTELNLVDTKYESNMKLAEDKRKVLFMSSTFLYRDEIDYIRKRIANYSGCLNYNYHVGQYLPDWHPWESIQDYFVGDKRTNGCRELFAIEFPWIIKLFGEIESYEVLSSKNTELPIKYNDNYYVLLKHINGNKGVLVVDVISRKAVRKFELCGENIYLTWDGTPTGLYEYDIETKKDIRVDLYDSVDMQEGYASFVVENAYQNELETFIGLVNGKGKARYSFDEDLKVLRLIDEVERGN